jgi:CRISPR-associated endonuclease/helicase Cas3
LENYWGQHGDGEAFCRKPEAYETADEAGERLVTRYDWKLVSKKEEIHITPIVALHPAVATYDPPRNDGSGLGFLLRDGKLDASLWPTNGYISQRRDSSRGKKKAFSYEQESYIEHITGLLRAYQSSLLQPQLRYPARVLEEELGLPAGAIDQAVRLAIACHDIGKLGTGWQRWCEEWQQKLFKHTQDPDHQIKPDKRPFAHTDFDGSREQRELQRTVRPSRPHHACESAELAAFFIEETLIAGADDVEAAESLARATVAAIARHHAATSREFKRIALRVDARDAIRAGLEVVRQGHEWTYDLANLDVKREDEGEVPKNQMTLPTVGNVPESLLYFLLVRVLRLADQRSFDMRRLSGC